MSMPMDGRVRLSEVSDKPVIVHRPPNVPEVPRWTWARETYVPANPAAYAITFARPRFGTPVSVVSRTRPRDHSRKAAADTGKYRRVGRRRTAR